MIANIDENIGRIFTTDNGTSEGCHLERGGFVREGYNAGMRGKKGWVYEGSHRVPLFIRWPGGGLVGGRDIEQLSAAIDLLPTLLDLCGLRPPEGVSFDGKSLKPLLTGQAQRWPDRAIVADHSGERERLAKRIRARGGMSRESTPMWWPA